MSLPAKSQPAAIDEAAIAAELQTRDLPELDLLIRTSGEVRLSNFLLWQAAYAELLFLDLLVAGFRRAGVRRCAAGLRSAQPPFWRAMNELLVRTLTG